MHAIGIGLHGFKFPGAVVHEGRFPGRITAAHGTYGGQKLVGDGAELQICLPAQIGIQIIQLIEIHIGHHIIPPIAAAACSCVVEVDVFSIGFIKKILAHKQPVSPELVGFVYPNQRSPHQRGQNIDGLIAQRGVGADIGVQPESRVLRVIHTPRPYGRQW